jgi:alkyldihydroxyacetonephosphate synthase
MRMMTFTGWGDPSQATDASNLPRLWPLIEAYLGISAKLQTPFADPASIKLPATRASDALLRDLRDAMRSDAVATDHESRVLHAYGKSYRDLLRALRGEMDRAPDAVIFPSSHEEVEQVMAIAHRHGVKLVPFGGGTNIVGAVEVSPAIDAPVITLSLRRMNRLLSLDAKSGIAVMQPGMLGPELEAALNARGFTLGHFPDSFEFSTLGGWLATRSAGMQSDTRGKIEDMVVSLRMVTPTGTLTTPTVPKASAGPDLNQVAVGSEGAFGVITEATMRVYQLQEHEYRGVLMPSFAAGVEFMHRCTKEGIAPATMRLSNPLETRLGQALKPPSTGWRRFLKNGVMAYLNRIRGFTEEHTCLLILGWEGGPRVAPARKQALKLARSLGGFDVGREVGNTWYARKYSYPYLRDFIMRHGGMVDVAETSALWSNTMSTYKHLSETLGQALRRDGYPGYVGCHLSHSYPEGVCLYFTFATARDEQDPLGQYRRIKRSSLDAILQSNAALSHHHALGYEHLPWLEQSAGATAVRTLQGLKTTFDPDNLCNPGKLVPSADSALDHYWPELAAKPNDEDGPDQRSS